MWNQFRRLVLGTVVEALLERGVNVDFTSIRIDFDPDSAFRVPRLNNYMRFKGQLTASLLSPMTEADREALRDVLSEAWPSLLKVVDIPIGDRLTEERNAIRVEAGQGQDQLLRVIFDLIAD